MSEIARSGKWNPGGGRQLELLPAAHVASYVRASPSAAPVITLVDGASWTRIYCTQGTLQYRFGSEFTDNGRLGTVEIKGFSPSDSASKADALDTLSLYEKVLARFVDNDGLTRIAGTKLEPLDFSYDLGTDPDVPGSRGYTLAIKGTLTQRPAYD